MDNRNDLDPLKAILTGIKISEFKKLNAAVNEKAARGGKKDEKEILRRLKIQNKKLIQQVSSLKKQLKQAGTEDNEFKIFVVQAKIIQP